MVTNPKTKTIHFSPIESSSKQSRNMKHKKGKKNIKLKDKKPKQTKQIWRKKENVETRNWLELPQDLTAMVLSKLGAVEILETAQKVCTSWRRICKDPLMWKCIDMHNSGELFAMPYDLEVMTRHAIDRSCSQLVDINIEYFGTDELMQYLADQSPQLTSLRLAHCYSLSDEGIIEAVPKLPLLTNVEITLGEFSKSVVEAIGRCCPLLKSFKFNCQPRTDSDLEFDYEEELGEDYFDQEALAIAANMPGIHHLMLLGNTLSNVGLQAILDSCPHLVSLDLRRCFNINLAYGVGKRCTQQIKHLRLPHDSTSDYPFQVDQDEDGLDNGSYSDDYDGYYESDTLDYDDYTRINYNESELDEMIMMNEILNGYALMTL